MQSCRVKFESENYFFFLNGLVLREEFRSPAGIAEAARALEDILGFRVTEMVACDEAGKPQVRYRYDCSEPLPPDKDRMALIKAVHNDGVHQRILQAPGSPLLELRRPYRPLRDVLARFFTLRTGEEIERLDVYAVVRECDGASKEIDKLRKTKKYSGQFTAPHQDAYGSKIEERLGEALAAEQIDFTRQQEVFHNGRLLTVLDMYIGAGNIAVFCDRFQYHYDKETVIKDRQQDRILQYLGYRVLRYTGSEIVGDVSNCERQIKLFMKKSAGGGEAEA